MTNDTTKLVKMKLSKIIEEINIFFVLKGYNNTLKYIFQIVYIINIE